MYVEGAESFIRDILAGKGKGEESRGGFVDESDDLDVDFDGNVGSLSVQRS